jgi:hypothetical protein
MSLPLLSLRQQVRNRQVNERIHPSCFSARLKVCGAQAGERVNRVSKVVRLVLKPGALLLGVVRGSERFHLFGVHAQHGSLFLA